MAVGVATGGQVRNGLRVELQRIVSPVVAPYRILHLTAFHYNILLQQLSHMGTQEHLTSLGRTLRNILSKSSIYQLYDRPFATARGD